MGYALVGSLGTVAVSTSAGLAASPLFGTGETPTTANDLLMLWVVGDGANTLPALPSGWTTGTSIQGPSCTATIFWKIAVGSEVAPTIAGATSVTWSAMLGEFSGNATSSPNDKTGTVSGTLASLSCAASAADSAAGELVVYASTAFYTTAATRTLANSLNNGATANSTNNNATSTANHYDLGFGITTGNSTADVDSWSTSTATHLTGAGVAMMSFKLPSVALTRTASDTLSSFTETAKGNIGLLRSASETLSSFTEAATRSPQTFIRAASDSLTQFSESPQSNVALPRTATDSLAQFTESAAMQKVILRASGDSLSQFTETVTRSSQSFARTATDSLTQFSEAPTRLAPRTRSATDSLSAFVETPVRGAQSFLRVASDSLSAFSDTPVRSSQSFVRGATDSLAQMTEVATRLSPHTRVVVDSLSQFTETPIRSSQNFVRTASDSLSPFSETGTKSPQSFIRSASDSLAQFSEVAALKGKVAALDSLSQFSDSVLRSTQAFHRSAVDSLTQFTEGASGGSRHSVTVSAADTLAAFVDTPLRIVNLPRQVSDTLTAFVESPQKTPQSYIRSANDLLAQITEIVTAVTAGTGGTGVALPWRLVQIPTIHDPYEGWTAQWNPPNILPIAIAGVSNGLGPAVVTTATPHGLHVQKYPYTYPQFVTISGVNGSGFVNGTWPVMQVLSATSFTIAVVNLSPYNHGGSVTVDQNPLPVQPQVSGNTTLTILFD